MLSRAPPMEENDEKINMHKEKFQNTTTSNTNKFPNNPPGVVLVPRGSKGPRSLYLHRYGDSFGFTLRHFIVYPPESIAEDDGRHAACGALRAPMDTIFVKHVRERSPAKQAGLQRGDRLVAVNGVPTNGCTYQQVVQLIANSPEYLHLLVVPKEEDVLQRCFPDTAYNPLSNQPTSYLDGPIDRATAQQIIAQRIPREFRVDAASWRQLHQPLYFTRQDLQPHQHSAESVLDHQHQIYSEIQQQPRPHGGEVHLRQKSRAQPQVPLYRKMGRRASEGNTLTEKIMMQMGVPDCASVTPPRRESTSSLASSAADSSKDSLNSFGSTSTLTGHEIDDSVRISRVRQSVKQKEEFLRTPVFREFHSRPRKLDKPVWPPVEPLKQNGGVSTLAAPPVEAHSPRNAITNEQRFKEAEPAPSFQTGEEGMALVRQTVNEARRMTPSHPNYQNVQKKAKEFECYPEDTRTDFSRSELARLSKKVLLPNVTERAHEYEVKTAPEPSRKEIQTQPEAQFSTLKRVQRDSRSLDSSGSTGSSVYEHPLSALAGQQLTGNVMISSGSKYIHCPPPGVSQNSSDICTATELQPFRARSNSAESWTTAIGDKDSITATPPLQVSTPPASFVPPHSPFIPLPVLQLQFPPLPPSISVTPPIRSHHDHLDFDRPERPARGHFIFSTDSTNTEPIAVKRRNKKIGKDDRSRRPESYLKATKGEQTSFGSDLSDYDEVSSQALRNRYRKWHPSPFHGDIEQLRKLFEDAASYKGGSGSGNSSTSSLDREKFSLTVPAQQKFKTTDAAVIREGLVNCKILEIDGKRAADRSWKQVTMILKGFKLFLCKDRHHQSPLGTSDVALDQSLAPGVDMRTSAVRVPDDYTKRKNVLRVSTVKPCRSEFLIQAESGEEFADWVKTLQQQVAISTEAELDHHSSSRQQAVPQTQPATTSIQVQGSHLSPQTTKNSKFISSNRSRSPTGQSPVSKTRKPSSQLENNQTSTTSPKSKTWRGRVAKQFKKFNPSGTNSPLSPTAPEVSTFGVPIEHCITSSTNNYLPRFVEVCTEIIDEKGLEVIGIYRVPGNNASITALTEEINRNFEEVPLEDQKWNDLHVVSSLLKSFLRKMPDSLVTSALYPQFIKADKIEDQKQRLEELRRLVRSLPKHNYHTLRHVILHLKRVADNSQFNRMEAKNLAIVFGPTIVRPESESMESMVTNMNNQCKIVETLIANAEWFFPEAGDGEAIVPQVPLAVPDSCDEFETNNQALLNNISKYEALKDQKEKNGALLTSLFTAAHRKVMRKPSRSHNTQESNRDEPTTPIGQKTFVSFMNQTGSEKTDYNQKDIQNPSHAMTEQQTQQQPQPEINKPMTEKNPWFNYKTDQSDFSRRVEIFKQETEAMLQRPRMTEISIPNISSGPLSSSIGNVNTNPTGSSLKPQADFLLSKTHSATNVFTRPLSNNKNSIEPNDVGRYSYNESSGASDTKLYNHYGMRRGSSVENVNSSNLDLNANNGGLKKVKYETENGNQRKSSLDSLHKIPTTDDESLLTTITKLLDQKLKEDQSDQSPLKTVMVMLEEESKNRSRPQETQYKDPSLHRSQYTTLPNQKFKSDLKENKDEAEKEQDTKEDVPDNERHILITNNKIHPGGVPLMTKVRRNESLKRTDSLTKTEKTESNINKKRELLQAGRRLGSTKNKRKNGTPDRSIKRRHTVGGTKDPDKVTYFLDNNNKENNRTSSPDLSSVRREKFLLEINLISAENMVVAPRRHLIGGNRPQSFPVPLESHV